MSGIRRKQSQHEKIRHGRRLADQAFSRAAGAPLTEGNHVRLLRDARENYPAWLDAIAAAKHHVHFESYIIHEDLLVFPRVLVYPVTIVLAWLASHFFIGATGFITRGSSCRAM